MRRKDLHKQHAVGDTGYTYENLCNNSKTYITHKPEFLKDYHIARFC